MRLSIDLATSPEMLDMGTVRRVVVVGQRLRTELLPWYVRWMFPQIEGVIACSDQPQWTLDWTEDGQRWRLPLPADAQQREPETPKGKPSRACTVLTGQEQWPDAALFQPPPGANTKLYVKLRNARELGLGREPGVRRVPPRGPPHDRLRAASARGAAPCRWWSSAGCR